MQSRIAILLIFVYSTTLWADSTPALQHRPKLQVINASQQIIDLFWVKSDSERVSNGSVKPGESQVIQTTIGHRFLIKGQADQSELQVVCEVPIQGVRFDPHAKSGIPQYYTQVAKANGFPIVASSRVSPYALKEAAFLVDMMLAKRPDIREAMIKSGARLCVIAHNEFTTDLPEFAHMAKGTAPGANRTFISAKDYWDVRARGTGGSETDPFCSCAEENLLGYPGDPYSTESILIHELAHNIHLRGLMNVDPTFDDRLKDAYSAAMKAGLWKDKYASVNHHEYFAEGVQSWFDDNREPDHDHNHVNTRAELIEYDAKLAALCREVFGDTELKYTKPATRLRDHLVGYDPSQAPTFRWPAHLQHVKELMHSKRLTAKESSTPPSGWSRKSIAGWSIFINDKLKGDDQLDLDNALIEIEQQLKEISRVVPPKALAHLQSVPLWISPEYPGIPPRAEYHPSGEWLRNHQRDPVMARGIEFTNVRIFDQEKQRMPWFVLHELAHAYHDQVYGFSNDELAKAHARAQSSGKYDSVEQRLGNGKSRTGRSYAITSPMEFFAESTEAYFGVNDFFPFNRKDLEQHDPDTLNLLRRMWDPDPKPEK